MTKKNILITGGTGIIGNILKQELNKDYNISILDKINSSDPNSFVGDISDFNSIQKSFKNQDVVIHLAADRRSHGEWGSVMKNNIEGTYNVFEAAKKNGIKRIIFASSNHATGGFYLVPPWSDVFNGNFDKVPPNYKLINEKDRIKPDGYYGVSKAFGEALGSYYSDFHNISSIHLRIGWVISDDDPTFSSESLSLWLSHKDLAQITRKSVESPESLKYGVFYATSDNYWKIYSIEKAKKILGYKPSDNSGKVITYNKEKFEKEGSSELDN